MASAAVATQQLGPQAQLGDWMKYADDRRRLKDYEHLGKMKVLVLEADKNVNVPGKAETSRVGLRMDWCNRAHEKGRGTREFFIPIGQTRDRRLLILEAPFLDEQNRVGLPKIPDPNWTRSAMSIDDFKRMNTPLTESQMTPEQRKVFRETKRPIYPEPYQSKEEAPLIDQPLERRYRGSITGFSYLWVFGPIYQILFQPDLRDRGLQATYWTIQGPGDSMFDPVTRTHMELIVNMQTGWGYFFGGRYEIRRGPQI